MDNNENDSNKIKIRVQISNDDYHDITIDWSISEEEQVKLIFNQLSIYTHVPVEKIESVWFTWPGTGFIGRKARLQKYHYKSFFTEMRTKDQFRDNDCFMFNSKLSDDYNKLNLTIELVHQDFAHETECCYEFCHTRKTRSWLDVVASKLNLEFESYIESCDHIQPANDVLMMTPDGYRRSQVELELNIKEYIFPECIYTYGPRNYKPCRG